MALQSTPLSVRRVSTLVLAASIAIGGVLAVSGSASAAAPPLKVTYHVTGTSMVHKTNSTLDLGPATLTLALRNNGHFTGSLPLPSTTTSFKALGLAPVNATASFVQAGKLTGVLGATGGDIHVTSKAKDYLQVSNVTTLLGLPVPVGDNCRTIDPLAISVHSVGTFDIQKGGTLIGTFAIGKFHHCNGMAITLNQLVSGRGNTIKLVLSHGVLGG